MTVLSASHCQVLGSQQAKETLSLESSGSRETKDKQIMAGKCSQETQNATSKFSLEPDRSAEVMSEDPRQGWAC